MIKYNIKFKDESYRYGLKSTSKWSRRVKVQKALVRSLCLSLIVNG